MIKSCILFIKAGTDLLTPIPTHIETLVKNRIEVQYENRYPNIELKFDKSECSNKGVYDFTGDSLNLRAETVAWPGERRYPLTELINGQQVEFPQPLIELETVAADTLALKEPEPSTWVKPALITTGVVATLAIVVGILAARKPHHAAPAETGPSPTRAVRRR